MQRVRVSHRKLFGMMAVISVLIAAFVLAWTVVDPEIKAVASEVTHSKTDQGETIVEHSNYCSSQNNLWKSISVTWPTLLLLFALVLAFMASRVREDINDTRRLSALIVAQFLFAGMQAVLIIVRFSLDRSDIMAYLSLLLSGECVASLLVFVIPKLSDNSNEKRSDEPLPDLFLNTTIMMMDVVNFTKWSSMREPVRCYLTCLVV